MDFQIVVCVKQVPVSNNLKIDKKTNNLIRSSEPGIMNPFDKNAIEEALKLRDRFGGKVTLLSMGPENFELTLRQGLAMGADDAILLSSKEFAGADTLATGYVLSQAIKKLGTVDIILFGRQSIDADTGQVGPIVAEFLDLPQVTYVNKVKTISRNSLEATRLLENLEQDILIKLPAVLTVRSELNEPRYPTPRNIQLSYQKEIKVWNEFDFELDKDRIGIKGSSTIVRKVWTPTKSNKQAVDLGNTAKEAAEQLLYIIRSKNVL